MLIALSILVTINLAIVLAVILYLLKESIHRRRMTIWYRAVTYGDDVECDMYDIVKLVIAHLNENGLLNNPELSWIMQNSEGATEDSETEKLLRDIVKWAIMGILINVYDKENR